jgi:hemerythrin-like domain-containing protein
MNNIELLRSQHVEIIEIVNSINNKLSHQMTNTTINEVISDLAILSGKFSHHLMVESEELYPSLVNHADKSIGQLAQLFIDEIAELTNNFHGYYETWKTSTLLETDMTGFVEQTQTIIRMLKQRIAKEDAQLFPLLSERYY